MASVLDPSDSTYETINRMLGSFVNTGLTLNLGKGNWIHQDVLYASKAKGGLNFIDAQSFFISLIISWIKRYATDRIDDHWANIIDMELKLSKRPRARYSHWGLKS